MLIINSFIPIIPIIQQEWTCTIVFSVKFNLSLSKIPLEFAANFKLNLARIMFPDSKPKMPSKESFFQ